MLPPIRKTKSRISKNNNENRADMPEKNAHEILKNADVTELADFRRLLAYVKGNISYDYVVLHSHDIILNEAEQRKFRELLSRYRKNEPISKIIGRKFFWNHEFYTNQYVLDPRQDTETVIEAVLQRFDRNAVLRFLDIGTGSGCILLSLLTEFPNAGGIGIDISAEAIATAEKNRKKIGMHNADFLNIGWNELASVVPSETIGDINVIVSNPPYIRSADINLLDENVKNYDPRVALDGGLDGLDAYREITAVAQRIFAKNSSHRQGYIFFEVGYDQAEAVSAILATQGFENITTAKDLNGIERVVIGCRPSFPDTSSQFLDPL